MLVSYVFVDGLVDRCKYVFKFGVECGYDCYDCCCDEVSDYVVFDGSGILFVMDEF